MQDGLSLLLLYLGGILLLIGAIGIWRLPDLFSRLHAAGVIDTLAIILILFGLVLQSHSPWIAIKLIMVLFFVLFTSPVAAHALAKAALHGKQQPWLPNDDPPAQTQSGKQQ